MSQHEILIETRQFGHSLRVTAVDAATGTEVVFQTPLSANPIQIKRLAADKMRYVMARK